METVTYEEALTDSGMFLETVTHEEEEALTDSGMDFEIVIYEEAVNDFGMFLEIFITHQIAFCKYTRFRIHAIC